MQDNIANFNSDIDPRLGTLYKELWKTIERINETNPLTWAAINGIVNMIATECSMTMIGHIDEDE